MTSRADDMRARWQHYVLTLESLRGGAEQALAVLEDSDATDALSRRMAAGALRRALAACREAAGDDQ